MKKCPNPECSFAVGRRKCPHKCPLCKAMMGPVLNPDPGPDQKPSKAKTKKAYHPTIEIESGLYSVQYHQHNR